MMDFVLKVKSMNEVVFTIGRFAAMIVFVLVVITLVPDAGIGVYIILAGGSLYVVGTLTVAMQAKRRMNELQSGQDRVSGGKGE